ncbi:MAG: hypothetical protein V1746_00670 [bacterium]
MSRNVLRRSNDIHIRRLWRWVTIISVGAAFGLIFVYINVQNIGLANDVKKLEMEMAELNKRNTLLQLEVAARMKPRKLQEKIAELGMQMVSIAELSKVKAPLFAPAYGEYAKKEDVP